MWITIRALLSLSLFLYLDVYLQCSNHFLISISPEARWGQRSSSMPFYLLFTFHLTRLACQGGEHSLCCLLLAASLMPSTPYSNTRSTGCRSSIRRRGTSCTFWPTKESSSSSTYLWASFSLVVVYFHFTWRRSKKRSGPWHQCSSAVVFGWVFFLQGKKVPKPAFLGKQIQELGIGTFRNIATVRQTATLYDALSIFVERRVSALPVVDDQGTRAATKGLFSLSINLLVHL